MRCEWEQVLLSDIMRFKNGKKRPATTGDIPVYGGNGILDFTNEANCQNCIVIGRVGAYCGSVFREPQKCWVSDNAICCTAKENSDTIFDYYLLKNLQLNKRHIGTSQPLLTQEILNKIEIICPPLTEQKRIAAILSALDDKIELNQRINDNLERQAQALFKSWFVDFEPFGGTMPLDWLVGTINDLAAEIVCGKTPSTKVADYYGSDIPFITIPDMHGKIYAVTTERYLSELGANSQVKKTLPKNSVCVSCIGTAGLVSLVATESQTNQQINSIIPKDGFSPYYIYLLMQTLSDTINKLGQSGSTIVNLNKAQFGKIQVVVPSTTVMTQFDTIMFTLFEMILENQKENLKLASLRDSLLPRLMSGELDVSDIDL